MQTQQQSVLLLAVFMPTRQAGSRLLAGFASCLAMSEMRGSYFARARGSLVIALQAS